MYSEPWYSQRFIQSFSRIFRHIQGYAYLATFTGAQLQRKMFPDFGKKGPDCAFDEMFIKVPWFHKPLLLPPKMSGCESAFRHYSFYKTLYLKCLTVF